MHFRMETRLAWRSVLRAAPVILLFTKCAWTESDVTDVHMIFSNHLDVGFNGVYPKLGTDNNIINAYFDMYFEQAINITAELKAKGEDRMVYMTHSWLVSMFLDCPPGMGVHCPTPEAQQRFVDAAQRGDIIWHAFPFNAQPEMFNAGLLKFAAQLTHGIDDRLGLPRKLVMSQRDVPGLTRAAVPILYEAGVRALSIGVNPGSAPPDTPHNTPFWWLDEPSGARLLTIIHPGGYSGNPVDKPEECTRAKGFPHVLCAAWRGDNQGPHPVDEFETIMNMTKAGFPDAAVYGSSYEAFFRILLPLAPDMDLPVVTGEIGDTWMYGVQSDSLKVAEYRTLLRVRDQLFWLGAEPAYQNFSRFLMKIPEHTWGPDVKTFLPDFHNWSNDAFHAQQAEKDGMYADVTYAWQRQRSYLQWAVEALSELPHGAIARDALEAVRVSRQQHPLLSGENAGLWRVTDKTSFRSPWWSIELGPTGALIGLQRLWKDREGAQWASPKFPLGELIYETFTEDDYEAIWSEYLYADRNYWIMRDLGKLNCSLANPRAAQEPPKLVEVWDAPDFCDGWGCDLGKINCTLAKPRRASVMPNLAGVWAQEVEEGGFHVLAKLEFPSWMVMDAGAPREVWLEIRSRAKKSRRLTFQIIWVNKTATRLPEALWFKFAPELAVADPQSWKMYKLGQPISPLEVINNGSQSMHGVSDEGISVMGAGVAARESLSIRSLDVSLVSPGKPTAFPKLHDKPDLEGHGISFNLANNIWGTNYLMWQPLTPEDGNIRFRFVIEAKDMSASSTASPMDPSSWASEFSSSESLSSESLSWPSSTSTSSSEALSSESSSWPSSSSMSSLLLPEVLSSERRAEPLVDDAKQSSEFLASVQ